MNKNKIKSTAKATIIYSISNVLVKMSGLILLPLYTSYISLAQFGLLGFYEITFEVLQLMSGLGIDNALSRWYWDKESGHDRKVVVFNASLVSLITTFIIMTLGFLALNNFSETLLWEKQSSTLIFWFIISSITRVLIRQPLLLMRIQELAVKQTVINIIRIFFVVGISFVTIAHYKMGLKGIFIAEAIANLLVIPYLYKHLIQHSKFHYSYVLVKEMLLFSLPLVASWVLTLVLTLSDRYIIRYYGTLEDTGIYNLAYKISNVIRVFVVHSFSQAYIPIFYKYMHDEDSKQFYIKSLTYYTFVAVIIALGLTIFGQEAIQIVAQSSEYWSAYKLLPYLVIGVIFAGLRQILVLPINKHKKTKIISITNISAGVLNIFANFILVPFTGVRGAALATALANIFVVLVYYYHVNKLEDIRYEDKKIVNAISLCIVLSAAAMLVANVQLTIRLPIKVALFVSFPLIMYLTKFYNKEEVQQMRDAIKQLKNKYIKTR